MKSVIDKVERFALKTIGKVFHGIHMLPWDKALLSGEELNDTIYGCIQSKYPVMICRFGSTEFENFSYEYIMRCPYLQRAHYFIRGFNEKIRRDKEYEQYLVDRLCTFSGFFPNDIALLPKYTDLVLDDMKEIDILGVWQKEQLFKDKLTNCSIAPMADLEPYDYDRPWSKALEGKTVLVIHPFAKSIESQYSMKGLIWDNPDVLPDFELKTIKAVQTIAGESSSFGNWFEALDYMKAQMDSIDYDVAIIGCGAYGFHLAAHAKQTGHVAIHLGGATQILFGIKGKRWEDIPAVSKFFNEYWVSPSKEETPRNNSKVENGCYW